VAGASFRDFLNGKLAKLPGERPTLDDWADHLTTLFPDVRLKRFLEMRGADAGSLAQLCAAPALWAGLIYDEESLEGALALISDWTEAERAALRASVPRLGLKAPFRSGTVRDLARATVELALAGLKRRRRLNREGEDESKALKPLIAIVEEGRSPADHLLEAYNGIWNRDIDKLFETTAL
jgi:glutamate--cysteine ligase